MEGANKSQERLELASRLLWGSLNWRASSETVLHPPAPVSYDMESGGCGLCMRCSHNWISGSHTWEVWRCSHNWISGSLTSEVWRCSHNWISGSLTWEVWRCSHNWISGPSRMTATNSIMTTPSHLPSMTANSIMTTPSHLPSTTHMSQKLSNTN